jgi:hypothetical protein
MKKLIYPFSLLAIAFALVLLTTETACSKKDDAGADSTDLSGNTDGNVTLMKKYDVEKGIIVMKHTNTLADLVYFDTIYFKEYGAIEVKYTYDDDGKTLKELEMQVGDGFLYQINMISKTGMKSSAIYASGTEFSPDFETWPTAEITKNNVKTLTDTTIVGKTCKFHYYNPSSTPTKVADYKGVVLFFETSMTGTFNFTTTSLCVSYEDNVTIPDSKFKIPAGITYSN